MNPVLPLIFPVGGEMKKVAGRHNFAGVRPPGGGWGVGGGGHRWKFQDKVTTKIVPNITNLIYAIFNHYNFNSTTVLSILFLYCIYKTLKSVRGSLSILVFFYHEKQKHFKLTNKTNIDLS